MPFDLGKFVTVRKSNNKQKSTVAVNTENTTTSLGLLDHLNRLQESAESLKAKLDKRGCTDGSFGAVIPSDFNRVVELVRDRKGTILYEVSDIQIFRISSIEELFSTNLAVTGRFTPFSDQILNQSVDQALSTLRNHAPSSSSRGYCKLAIQSSANDIRYNLEKRGRFLPFSIDLLNISDNSLQHLLKSAEAEILPEVARKFKLNRKKPRKRLLNYLDLADRLSNLRLAKPQFKSNLKLGKLGRYSAEDRRSVPATQANQKHPESPTFTNFSNIDKRRQSVHLNSTVKMSNVQVDNKVVKWYSLLIPILEINRTEHCATAIKKFMERCRHVFRGLDDDQQRTFLFTIYSRMTQSVVQKLKKLTFESLEDLEKSLKEAFPYASNREPILESLRQSRQNEGETVESFVNRLRVLLERGHSEDSKDPEYEITAKLSLKKGVQSEVVYIQLMQLESDASFEEMAVKAIAADQQLSMRTRNNTKETSDQDFIEKFKKLLSIIDTKTSNPSENFQINSLSNNSQAPQQRNVGSPELQPVVPSAIAPAQANTDYQQQQQYQQRPLRTKVCFRCGQPGHFKNRCPQYRQRPNNFAMGYQAPQMGPYQQFPNPYAWQVPGHNPYIPYTNNVVTQSNDSSERCGMCGLGGHNPTNCPRNQAGCSNSSAKESEICQLCDGTGHIAKNCPTILSGNSTRSAL